MGYEVGQIVYLLSHKNTSVIPAQIVEEVCRKTLEGENISYTVRLPDQNKNEMSLDELNVETFISAEKLEDYMMSKAKEGIRNVINQAKQLEEKAFEKIDKLAAVLSESADSSPLKEEDNNHVEVDLGDGVTGRVNISEISEVIR